MLSCTVWNVTLPETCMANPLRKKKLLQVSTLGKITIATQLQLSAKQAHSAISFERNFVQFRLNFFYTVEKLQLEVLHYA